MRALTIAQFTLHETVRRRLIVSGALLSLAFLGLFALGFSFLYEWTLANVARRPSLGDTQLILAASMLTTLGLYAVYFLSSFLALFLSVGCVAGEIDAGTLHALLARPIRRSEFLLGRWLAYAALSSVYVSGMAGALLVIARVVAGYQIPDPLRAISLMALGAVVLLSISLLGSTLLSTLANGVVAFTLFGLAWLAGIIEYIGGIFTNEAMINLGIAISLLVPSDALWRAASFYVQSPAMIAMATSRGGLPFAGTGPPATALLIWAAAYPVVFLIAAVVAFSRRDL